MIGISLPPAILSADTGNEDARRMMEIFHSPDGLLEYLKELGIASVELRSIRPEDDPFTALSCARKVWNAGLSLTVHGLLTRGTGSFEKDYAALLPLLTEASGHQDGTTITVHAFRAEEISDLDTLSRYTTEILDRWSKDAARFGFRLSLENNQKHSYPDAGITCSSVAGMIRDLDPETVGTTFDFGHYYSNTKKGVEKEYFPPEEFLGRCFQTHIHNYLERTHMPFTPGYALPLDDYVNHLQRSGYRNILNLELSFERFRDLDWRAVILDSVNALRAAEENARCSLN